VYGSDLDFDSGRATLRSLVFLPPPERTSIERTVLAAQLILGRATRRAPVDEMVVPGAASEMDLPLRAYRSRADGVLGRTPIGRSLDLLNVEWRVRLGRWKTVQVGGVAFYDAARVAGRVGTSDERFLHAAGAGLRAAILSLILRMDYAVALSEPSSRALTAGLGNAF
jgi:hypothetical protein